jgi:hypothetical protein
MRGTDLDFIVGCGEGDSEEKDWLYRRKVSRWNQVIDNIRLCYCMLKLRS